MEKTWSLSEHMLYNIETGIRYIAKTLKKKGKIVHSIALLLTLQQIPGSMF